MPSRWREQPASAWQPTPIPGWMDPCGPPDSVRLGSNGTESGRDHGQPASSRRLDTCWMVISLPPAEHQERLWCSTVYMSRGNALDGGRSCLGLVPAPACLRRIQKRPGAPGFQGPCRGRPPTPGIAFSKRHLSGVPNTDPTSLCGRESETLP
jgi:hypothetical protein